MFKPFTLTRGKWMFSMAMGAAVATSAGAMPVTELDWRVVNDTVMGGVSRSRVDTAGTVRFEGELSLERNGGFVSMRAPTAPGSFDQATALRVVLYGDGRTYDLTLRRADVPLRAGSYRVRVDTEVGLTEVLVPLSDFRPTSFGRPVPGAPALDTGLDQISSIGVLLADKQPGPFSLEVLEISVVSRSPSDRPSRDPLLSTLRAAVSDGVPLYNRGEVGACRDIYDAALRQALDQPGPTPGEASIIEDALADAETQPAAEGAWTLRHAIDSVLRSGI